MATYKRPETLADSPSGYCPGCLHSLATKLVAEAIEELRDLELALEGEGSLAASRDPLHRDVADTDGVHGPSAFQVARAF